MSLKMSEKKEEILARASPELKGLIVGLRDLMNRCVLIYEKIRDKAIAEGLSVEDTKMLIAIICDKMNLNSYYKKSFIKMVYPPTQDLSKLTRFNKAYTPKPFTSDLNVEELNILRVTKQQIPEKIMKHIMRVYQDWYELKLVDGIPVNIRCDTEPDWAIMDDSTVIALGTTEELAGISA